MGRLFCSNVHIAPPLAGEVGGVGLPTEGSGNKYKISFYRFIFMLALIK